MEFMVVKYAIGSDNLPLIVARSVNRPQQTNIITTKYDNVL